MGVELDHIGTGQTRCAALMVDGGFSHDLARAFVPYFVSKPCEQVTVVDVDFPARISLSRHDILSLWTRGDIGL